MKANRTPLTQLSKRVFNAEHRLTIVGALMAQDGLLTTSAVASASEVAYSTAHEELNLLADLGLLQRVVPERQVLFQRIPSPFWEWCGLLIDSVELRSPVPQPDG